MVYPAAGSEKPLVIDQGLLAQDSEQLPASLAQWLFGVDQRIQEAWSRLVHPAGRTVLS